MQLYDELIEYKKLTVSMIDKVKHHKDFDEDIDNRQKIIERLKDLKFTKEEIKNYVKELQIKDLDEQLEYAIKKERKRIHEELIQNKKNKIANDRYTQYDFNSSILNTTK